MDSRDILIIGAVAVAAFLYYRSHQAGASVALPAGQGGAVGAAAMTSSAAATTTGPIAPPVVNQVGPPMLSGFGGFSALGMGGGRFIGSAVSAVITDAIAPAPVVRPPVMSSPVVVGGGRVFPTGAGSMGPQPPTTRIVNPFGITRY